MSIIVSSLYGKIITSNIDNFNHNFYDCESGDTLFNEKDGLAYLLLEELLRDNTCISWRALITSHQNEDFVGQEIWIQLSTNNYEDIIVIKNH